MKRTLLFLVFALPACAGGADGVTDSTTAGGEDAAADAGGDGLAAGGGDASASFDGGGDDAPGSLDGGNDGGGELPDAGGDGGADAADDTGGIIAPLGWCEGETAFAYAPTAGLAVETFPDDYYTTPDPSTVTGLRVRFDADLAPWLSTVPGGYDKVFVQLEELDGFGTTAGVLLRFTGPIHDVPSGEASLDSDAIQLVDLSGDAAVRIPFEVQTADEDSSLMLWPMVPLVPGHRHGVILTRDLPAADGGCIAPSPTLRKLLGGTATDPRLVRLLPRYEELLAKTGVAPGDVSAATVFTAQSIVETSVAAAADIAARGYEWAQAPVCTDVGGWRECDGTFVAWDYRDAAGVVQDGSPQASYELAVRLWLPLEAPAPWPVVVFGHGLGSDRGQAKALAEVAAPMGIATVAIDAVAHGVHPGAPPNPSTAVAVAAFFGISLETLELDGLVLRDNWRQSTYDKLQLVRLLTDAPDLDDDGAPELDPDHLSYLGVSLGGIMGAELLALSPALGAGILSVPGGRVTSIMSDSETFAPILFGLTPPGATKSDVLRFFPVLQTLIERGDASNYAPYVLSKRLQGAGPAPQLLLNMAVGDATVPNVCTRSLARALGVPVAPPVLQTVGVVETAPTPPFSGNLSQELTAGLFQYDRVTKSPGADPVVAEHDNVAKSQEGLLQETHFLQSWLDTGVGEIIDPYEVLGTAPLE